MNKRLFTFLILLCSIVITTNAQTISQGQKFQTITTTKTNAVVEGFGQNTQMDNIITAEVEAKMVSDTGYLFVNTPKRLQAKSSVMGQTIDIDSDRPADKQGEAGSIINTALNIPMEFHVNKAGKITAVVSQNFSPAAPSFMDALKMGGLPAEGQPYPLLLTFPNRQLKQGDSWIDSSVTNESLKIVTTYVIKSITNNDYIISNSIVTNMNIPMTQQGMELKIEMSGTTKGDCVYEKSTGLLRTSNSISEMKGTFGMMGKTSSISMVVTTSVDVKKL